jgi:hypothetical protein
MMRPSSARVKPICGEEASGKGEACPSGAVALLPVPLGDQLGKALAQLLDLALEKLELLGLGIEHFGAGRAVGRKLPALRSAATRVERAGMPIIVAPSGTSLVTTALAPIRARSPTVIGPSTCAPEPMMTPLPIVGWRLPPRPPVGLVPPRVTCW